MEEEHIYECENCHTKECFRDDIDAVYAGWRDLEKDDLGLWFCETCAEYEERLQNIREALKEIALIPLYAGDEGLYRAIQIADEAVKEVESDYGKL